MERKHAAVVTSFAEPPHYREFEVPQPTTDREVLVDVLAVGLHPRVRSGARSPLLQHRRAAHDPRYRRRRPAVGRQEDLLHRRRRCTRNDGRQGGGRPATLHRPARRCRGGKGCGRPEPGHVRLGGTAPTSPDPVGPERARPRRHRQCRDHGRAGGQTARRRAGSRRRSGQHPARRARLRRCRRRRPARRGRRRDGKGPECCSRRGRHRHRLSVGPAGAAGDPGSPHRSVRSQPPDGLDPGRRGGRSDDRIAVGRPAICQPPHPGGARVPSRRRCTSPSCRPSSTRSMPAPFRSGRTAGRSPTWSGSGFRRTYRGNGAYSSPRAHPPLVRTAASSAPGPDERLWPQDAEKRSRSSNFKTLPAGFLGRASTTSMRVGSL